MEKWKDITGYEGLYQVSNLGRVKSLSRFVTLHHGSGYWTTERILENRFFQRHGYYLVALFNNGRRRDHKPHRLVAEAFITEEMGKPNINHKDGNKLNNRVENLEWCTRSENQKHAWKTGLMDANKKLVQCLCTGRRMFVRDASKELKVSAQYMWSMLNGSKPNWSNFINY